MIRIVFFRVKLEIIVLDWIFEEEGKTEIFTGKQIPELNQVGDVAGKA